MTVGVPSMSGMRASALPRPSAAPGYFPDPRPWSRPPSRTPLPRPRGIPAPPTNRFPKLPSAAAMAPLLVAGIVVGGGLWFAKKSSIPEGGFYDANGQLWLPGTRYSDYAPDGQFTHGYMRAFKDAAWPYYPPSGPGVEVEWYGTLGRKDIGSLWRWMPTDIFTPTHGPVTESEGWVGPAVPQFPGQPLPQVTEPYLPPPVPGKKAVPTRTRPRYNRPPQSRPTFTVPGRYIDISDGKIIGTGVNTGTRPPRGTREVKVRNKVLPIIAEALDIASELLEVAEIWMELAGIDFEDYDDDWQATVDMWGPDGAAWGVDPVELLTEVWNNVQMDRPWGKFWGAHTDMLRDLGLSTYTNPAW